MQIQITPEQRQKLMQHADYPKMMGEAVAAIKVDGSMIPASLKDMLMSSIEDVDFISMSMDMETYKGIINEPVDKWGIGVVQKACSIILQTKPNKIFSDRIVNAEYVSLLPSYLTAIEPIYNLHNECTRLLTEARDSVTNKLWTREKIAGK